MSERANGPVLQSIILVVLAHSEVLKNPASQPAMIDAVTDSRRTLHRDRRRIPWDKRDLTRELRGPCGAAFSRDVLHGEQILDYKEGSRSVMLHSNCQIYAW